MQTTAANKAFFIEGNGEMAGLMRSHNWSASVLGSQEYWPRNLISTLDLLLHSAFPMFLFWGKEHTCFYNDAFRPALGNEGKHPSALGSPGKKVWSEIWTTIEPMIHQVMEGQSTGLMEDQYIPIYRNGKIDDAYWTFSYNPVKNDAGTVQGVLAIVHETTNKIKEKREAEALQLQFHQALEACDLGTFDLDPQTMTFSCNHKTKQVFGLGALENVSLQTALDVIHPDDRALLQEAINQALDIRSGGRYDVEYRIVQPRSKKQKIVKAKGRVYFDVDSRPVRFGGTILDITEEKSSGRHRKKLQQLVENSNDFTSMADLDGRMTYLNAAGRKLIGLDNTTDIASLAVKDFYSEQGFEKIKNEIIPALNTYKQWTGVVKIKHHQTGEEIPCYGNYMLIADPDSGEIISRGATLRDLRPELIARKELEDSDKRFRNLVQEAPVATAIYIGSEMKIQWANDAMIKLWGKDKSVIGKTIREALPELEGQPFHQQLDKVFETGIMYQGTEDPGHLVVDGQLRTFYFNFSYKPLRDVEGNIYGILNMAIDVTESVTVKRKLEESERNFRNLIMQAPVGLTLLTGDNHIVELANDDYLELVGREREKFIGHPIWELIPEAKAQGFDIILQNVKESGKPFFGNEIPVTLVRNGEPETVYINFVYEPLFDEERKVHSILVIAIDVTRQVTARKLAENAEEKARIAIESARLGTYEVNLRTMEVHASPRFNELFDVEASVQHQDYFERIHPDDRATRQAAHELALQTGRLEYECRIVRRDGTENWIHLFGQFYFDENGAPEKIIGIAKDTTKEKVSEQELEKRVKERTEELTKLNEELQQFTYISSHDLKEPLRKIQMFTGIIRDEAGITDPKHSEYLEKVLASSKRMTALINDLLNYSTLSATDSLVEDNDLSTLVKNIWEDMEIAAKERNATLLADPLPVIKGIPFQVNQLFYNLLNNALKFSKAATPALIQIRCAVLEAEEQKQFPSLAPGSYYKIEVRDNGIGFEQRYAEKIFEVFQRLHLKHKYPGNGIGLSICKKIVQNHKGIIYAQSAPGEGSSFVVLLPK
jgi:PAS domain S-box-containing protein